MFPFFIAHPTCIPAVFNLSFYLTIPANNASKLASQQKKGLAHFMLKRAK